VLNFFSCVAGLLFLALIMASAIVVLSHANPWEN
jgi:hypothetical protein